MSKYWPVKQDWHISDLKRGDILLGNKQGDSPDYDEVFTFSYESNVFGMVYNDRGYLYKPKQLLRLAVVNEKAIKAGEPLLDVKRGQPVERIPYRVTDGACYFQDQPDGIKYREKYHCRPFEEFIGFVSPLAAPYLRPDMNIPIENIQHGGGCILYFYEGMTHWSKIRDDDACYLKLKCPWGCYH